MNRTLCRPRPVLLLAVITWLVLAPGTSHAIMWSVQTDGLVVEGVSYARFDVIWHDPVAGTSTLVLANSVFDTDSRVDGLQRLPGGLLALSIFSTSRILGGLAITDGDIVLYDPIADVATILFDESLFADDADVDGFQILPNGHILLSTDDTETLAGLTFLDGDVVEYDPVAGTASVVFSESLYGANEEVDALWRGSDGSFYLSTFNVATLGGLEASLDDLVRYFPGSNTSVLALDGSDYPPDLELVSGFLPEPSGLALVVGFAGTLACAGVRRGRARDGGR